MFVSRTACACHASNSAQSRKCRPPNVWDFRGWWDSAARTLIFREPHLIAFFFRRLTLDCLQAARRDARQPPLATQHDTRTRGSRPTADGTLTEKTSKRRRDERAACKASREGGGVWRWRLEEERRARNGGERGCTTTATITAITWRILRQKGMSVSIFKAERVFE